MVVAALFWSGAFITGKLAIHQIPPFSLTFFRFLFALPLIFLILFKRQPERFWPTKEQWLPLILLGVIGTFAYHVLFFSCLKYTTAINSSLIGSTLPMITTLLAVLFVGEKITLPRGCGMLLAFGGIFLVVTNGQWAAVKNLEFNPGDVLMFAAVWCFASYSLLSRIFMQKYKISPTAVTAYTFLVCTLVALPCAIWEQPESYLPAVTIGGWLAVIYMAVFASVLGYLFQLMAMQKIGAPKTVMFVNLVPVFTIIQSVIFLGEIFTGLKLACTGLIIAGVYLASRPEAPKGSPAVAALDSR